MSTDAPGAPATASPACADGRPLRKDAAANRDRILCAAAQIFAESGLGATIDDIAVRAGVGVGTVYRRFASKADLVDALFEQEVQAIEDLAEEALCTRDAWQGLVQFLVAVQAMQSTNRGLFNALFDRSADTAGIGRHRARLHALATRLVARAKDEGRLRPDFSATDMPLLLLMVGTIDLYTGSTAPGTSARMLGLCIDGMRNARRQPTALPSPPLTAEQLDRSIASWQGCPAATPG